jgi:hypothetical protein
MVFFPVLLSVFQILSELQFFLDESVHNIIATKGIHKRQLKPNKTRKNRVAIILCNSRQQLFYTYEAGLPHFVTYHIRGNKRVLYIGNRVP